MPQISKATTHLFKKTEKTFNHTIEKLAYAAGIISPLATIPQLLEIWLTHDAQGVSIITWTVYLFIAMIMTLYGIIHQTKPLIIMYGSLIIINTFIVIGIIIY